MQTSQTCFWGSPKLSPTCGELGWILPLRQRSVIRHLFPNIEVDHANLWRLEPFGICSDEWHDLRLALSRTVKLWPAQDCSHLVLWIFRLMWNSSLCVRWLGFPNLAFCFSFLSFQKGFAHAYTHICRMYNYTSHIITLYSQPVCWPSHSLEFRSVE